MRVDCEEAGIVDTKPLRKVMGEVLVRSYLRRREMDHIAVEKRMGVVGCNWAF